MRKDDRNITAIIFLGLQDIAFVSYGAPRVQKKLGNLHLKKEFSRGQCYYPKAYVRDRSKEEN